MSHRVGEPFDDDDRPVPWADYEDAPPEQELTVAERVKLGIALGSHLDENREDRGIVPFHAHLHEGNILDALTGDERRKVANRFPQWHRRRAAPEGGGDMRTAHNERS